MIIFALPIDLCKKMSIIDIEMCEFRSTRWVELCIILRVDYAEKCGGALCYIEKSNRLLRTI